MDNYQPNQSCACMRCRSRGLTGPVVLITLGVLFLLSELHVASFHSTWPIVLIAIGLVKVLGGNADSSGHVDFSTPPAPAAPPSPGTAEPREVDHV